MDSKSSKTARRWALCSILGILILAAAKHSPAVGAQDSAPALSLNPSTGTTGSDRGQSPASPAAVGAFPGAASYDSGWLAIDAGQTLILTHDLGGSTDNYLVDLRFHSGTTDLEYHGINQLAYGGNQLISPPPSGYAADDLVGAYWRSLTASTIKVSRMPQDKSYAGYVRVRIWVVTSESWDSGWKDVTPDSPSSLAFAIAGGSRENYLVYLEFKDTGSYINPLLSLGVHQRFYGGASLAGTNDQVGAYWRNLTDNSITVYCRPDETRINQVRVRIWSRAKATYDSGWVPAPKGLYGSFGHNVGGNPDDYIVDLQFDDAAVWGVNQRCYGGCDLRTKDGIYADKKTGAYWRNLSRTGIEVGRRTDDEFAVKVRVRIWNIWTPTRPNFDSGWRSTMTGTVNTLTHNLGGSPDDYFVNFIFSDTSWKVHQLYYGIKYFGENKPSGYSGGNAAGMYWRSLDSDSVVVYRGGDDTTTDQWRLRIWKMPKPDYDSGYTSIPAGTALPFNHGLVGSSSEFWIDVTFLDADPSVGINQRYWGGAVTHAATDHYYGASWGNFTATDSSHSMNVYRFPDDTTADKVRVRIWRIKTADYMSGYTAIAAGATPIFIHNLRVDTDRLLVDVTAQYGTSFHKYCYGRVDNGTGSPFPGTSDNDRMGFSWYNLTSTIINVQRMQEDNWVQYVNVRIWALPVNVFLPVIRR